MKERTSAWLSGDLGANSSLVVSYSVTLAQPHASLGLSFLICKIGRCTRVVICLDNQSMKRIVQ